MQKMNNPLFQYHSMAERFNRDLIGLTIPDEPTILSDERADFRVLHLEEELVETDTAFQEGNFEQAVDGLIDLTYVALGALVEMGINVNGVFGEVHDRNMAKVRGSVAKRSSNGFDAIKPEGWTPPDLAPYLTVTKEELTWLADLKAQLNCPINEASMNIQIKAADHLNVPRRKVGADRNPRRKFLVIGHARHGKDTVCDILKKEYGLQFTSSSMFCAEHVMMPFFKGMTNQFEADGCEGQAPPYYDSARDCFEDRGSYRQIWYEQIAAFNTPDKTALARAIFQDNDVYCGLRHSEELAAGKEAGLFDAIIWVDRSSVLPPESADSCSVTMADADWCIDNNGTLEDLRDNTNYIAKQIITQLVVEAANA